MTPTVFSERDRVAIAELVEAAAMILTSSLPPARALGAMLCERAANIIRGQATCCWTDEDVIAFAKEWDIDTPAAFNEPEIRRLAARATKAES